MNNNEVKAILGNLKEQKKLEQTVASIGIEKSYTARLLLLHSREFKQRQNSLILRKGKITSHLTPKEMAQMQAMEMEGIFKHSMHTNSRSRIAAAVRRLKLDADNSSDHLHTTGSVQRPFTASATRRGNSVSLSLKTSHPSSTEDVYLVMSSRNSDHPSKVSDVKQRKSRTQPKTAPSFRGTAKHRKLGTVERPTLSSADRKTNTEDKRPKLLGSTDDAKGKTSPVDKTKRPSSTRKVTSGRREALDDRKQANQMESAEVHERRLQFLKKIDTWVKDNPAIVKEDQERQVSTIEAKIPTIRAPQRIARRRGLSEKLSTHELWKDIRKCRYLRIPDSKIDFSGINTLVRDQMTLFQSSVKRETSYLEELPWKVSQKGQAKLLSAQSKKINSTNFWHSKFCELFFLFRGISAKRLPVASPSNVSEIALQGVMRQRGTNLWKKMWHQDLRTRFPWTYFVPVFHLGSFPQWKEISRCQHRVPWRTLSKKKAQQEVFAFFEAGNIVFAKAVWFYCFGVHLLSDSDHQKAEGVWCSAVWCFGRAEAVCSRSLHELHARSVEEPNMNRACAVVFSSSLSELKDHIPDAVPKYCRRMPFVAKVSLSYTKIQPTFYLWQGGGHTYQFLPFENWHCLIHRHACTLEHFWVQVTRLEQSPSVVLCHLTPTRTHCLNKSAYSERNIFIHASYFWQG